MDNSTNFTSLFVDRGAGYVAYKLILLLCLQVPIFVVDVLLIVAILADRSMNNAVRVVLLNIPIACLVVCVGFFVEHVTATSLTLSKLPLYEDPALFPCQLIVYLIAFGGAARLVFMALFAITTYVIVRVGAKKVKSLSLFLEVATIVLWLFLALYTAILFAPSVAEYKYDEGVSCTPDTNGAATYIFIGLEMVLFCIVPFAITVIMPILTLCYLKGTFITEDITLKKLLSKFALFLIIGNTMAIIGLAVPVLFVVFSSEDSDPTLSTALVRSANIVVHISLLPSPVLILVYFTSVRKTLGKMLVLFFCCCCKKTRTSTSSQNQDEKVNMGQAFSKNQTSIHSPSSSSATSAVESSIIVVCSEALV